MACKLVVGHRVIGSGLQNQRTSVMFWQLLGMRGGGEKKEVAHVARL